MKKLLLALSILILSVSSCSNADPKKMAEDICGCVQTKKKLSSQARKVILNAAKSDDEFRTAIQTELQAIDDEEKKQSVSDELTAFFEAVQSKKTMDCADKIDKKYRVMKADEKKIQKQMVSEMSNVDGCEAYAAVVKLGMEKNGDKETTKDEETTDEETEKPVKKKKTTEDEL